MKRQQNNYYDVLIIGAGISGISAAYHLQTYSPDKSFVMLEAREEIGGTWDLFKYPGIRSDSDMYTLGFSFRPWTNPKAIADGPSIMAYLHEAVEAYHLKDHIHFGRKAIRAEWSSEEARWTVSTHSTDGQEMLYQCNFLFSCSGYYRYDEGYTPQFPGRARFQGQIIHPQFWPDDLVYEGKKIVIIGSGATAITLVPSLAERATHVSMLQRSPTYVMSIPAEDKMANFFNKYLPPKLAYSLTRWKKIMLGRWFYWYSRKRPEKVARMLIEGVRKELGEDYEVEKHFHPHIQPLGPAGMFCSGQRFFQRHPSRESFCGDGSN